MRAGPIQFRPPFQQPGQLVRIQRGWSRLPEITRSQGSQKHHSHPRQTSYLPPPCGLEPDHFIVEPPGKPFRDRHRTELLGKQCVFPSPLTPPGVAGRASLQMVFHGIHVSPVSLSQLRQIEFQDGPGCFTSHGEPQFLVSIGSHCPESSRRPGCFPAGVTPVASGHG